MPYIYGQVRLTSWAITRFSTGGSIEALAPCGCVCTCGCVCSCPSEDMTSDTGGEASSGNLENGASSDGGTERDSTE